MKTSPAIVIEEPVNDKADVSVVRQRIDEIDQRIIGLIHTRKVMSQQVQRTRIDAGGQRVEPIREAAITKTYCAPFGEAGSALAAALLRICRGQHATQLPDEGGR
ncbi:chorismate mutase [Saccharopolyspora sp. NPDC050389]|uniref:chorismate mutase n=1 Tax=Saccharopolyspora sp. NPDC050389 TaxID=3155516 RepID=UPI0033EB987D